MHLARALLSFELLLTTKTIIMPKKTVKKAAKKAVKKSPAKKATTKVAKKATAKNAAKKAPAKSAVKKTAKKAPKKIASKPANKLATSKEAGYEEISHAAYLIYMSRVESGHYGDEIGDWLAAEASLNDF